MEPIQESNKTNVNGIDTPVEVSINSLPSEVIRVIFSQMESLDPAQLLTVSKLWKTEVINCVKEEEFLTTQAFISKLIENLKLIALDLQDTSGMGLDSELDSDAIEDLHNLKIKTQKMIGEANEKLVQILIWEDITIDNPFNLVTIKTSLSSVEDKIIDILKDLDRDVIVRLDDMCKNNKTPVTWDMEVYPNSVADPEEFTNLFFLVNNFKYLETMKVHDDDLILRLAMSLSSRGFADRAVKLCKKLTDEPYQKNVIDMIAINMCEGQHYDKGIKIAKENGIEEQVLKHLKRRSDMNLSNRVTELFVMGKFDEGITVANMLDDNLKNETLHFATLQLIARNNMEGATRVYDLISDESLKATLKRFIDYQQKK